MATVETFNFEASGKTYTFSLVLVDDTYLVPYTAFRNAFGLPPRSTKGLENRNTLEIREGNDIVKTNTRLFTLQDVVDLYKDYKVVRDAVQTHFGSFIYLSSDEISPIVPRKRGRPKKKVKEGDEFNVPKKKQPKTIINMSKDEFLNVLNGLVENVKNVAGEEFRSEYENAHKEEWENAFVAEHEAEWTANFNDQNAAKIQVNNKLYRSIMDHLVKNQNK